MTPAKINALKLSMNNRNHVDDALEYTFVGILQHNLKFFEGQMEYVHKDSNIKDGQNMQFCYHCDDTIVNSKAM